MGCCPCCRLVLGLFDPSLSTIFPSLPQLSFQRNPTLADSLVRASVSGSRRPPTGQVPPIPIPRLDSRIVRCADKRCKICPRAEGRRVLFSTVSNTPYTFHETFTCTDTSLIYCIICSKCGKLYIGLTSNSLRVRFRAHRHFSETKRRIPLYRHFVRKSHDFLRDHRIVPLEHCEPDALPEREAFWIRTLHTLIPHGLTLYMVNHTIPITALSFLRVSHIQIYLPPLLKPKISHPHHNHLCTTHARASNVAR